ncbi:hypothetical protein AAC387_Pa02g3324 [Persea americana]
MADVMGAVFQDLVTRCMTTFVNLDIRQTKGPLCYLRPGSRPFFCRTFSRNAETHSLSTDGKILNSRPLKMFPGSCYLPKPGSNRGDDAHFICEEDQTFGVADGVGGWASMGVDAGEFARQLIYHAECAIKDEPKGAINLMRVLEKAFSNTRAIGGSTACIAALRDEYIHAVNIGDSGFMVVRKGCVPFHSPVQQHFFNCPYQLGSDPNSDPPSLAENIKFHLATGDVIVAGTDGLFDNLFDNEVVDAVLQGKKEGLGSQEMASRIAQLAQQRAHGDSDTPFSVAAREAGYSFSGGKIDDITVIVANVACTDASDQCKNRMGSV